MFFCTSFVFAFLKGVFVSVCMCVRVCVIVFVCMTGLLGRAG